MTFLKTSICAMELLLLLFIGLLSVVNSTLIQTCKHTAVCPTTKDQWNNRSKDFVCLVENTFYTCLQNEKGEFMEACLPKVKFDADVVGCPFIICHQGLPHIEQKRKFTLCQEGVSGCPLKGHESYILQEIYKYPACFLPYKRNLTIEKIHTFSTYTPSEESTCIIIVSTIVPLLTSFLLMCVIIIWIKGHRKYRRCDQMNNQLPMDEENIPMMIIANEDPTWSLKNFKEVLYKKNDELTRCIPELPLQNSKRFLMDEIFSSISVVRKFEKARPDRDDIVISPSDMLFDVSRVLLIGLPGRGKTTLCHWLAQNWCKEQPAFTHDWQHIHDQQIEGRSKFDFLFLIKLCEISKTMSSLQEIICKQLFKNNQKCHDIVHEILSSPDYRCLIIFDGLDELKSGIKLPITNFPSCTTLITTRPVRRYDESNMFNEFDRILEIKGLDENGIKSILEKICNHFALDKRTSEYKSVYGSVARKLKKMAIHKLMQVPLFATLSVHILYNHRNEELDGGSLTSIYLRFLDLMIGRANSPHPHEDALKLTENHLSGNIPQILKTFQNLTRCLSTLYKLAKLAYLHLVYDDSKLKPEVENRQTLDEDESQLGLDISLLGSDQLLLPRCNIISFSDSSIQELFAALHVVKHEKESFKQNLTNVKEILRLSGVLIFVAGLDPSLGGCIMQEVARVLDKEAWVTEYRQNLPDSGNICQTFSIFELQRKCFREIRHARKEYQQLHQNQEEESSNAISYISSETSNTAEQFCITDVRLVGPDSDFINDTAELLSTPLSNLKSLYLYSAPSGRNGIDDALLTRFLDESRSLKSLYINGYDTSRILHHINVPSLVVLSLTYVKISDINPVDDTHSLVTLLSHMTCLQELNLNHVTLGNKDLGLSSEMTSLRKVNLEWVSMSLFDRFLHSLLSIEQPFEVRIVHCFNDECCFEKLKMLPHFQIDWYDGQNTHFRRKGQTKTVNM